MLDYGIASLELDALLNFAQTFSVQRVYYIFANYELPFTTGRLMQKDMIRAIDNGLAPSDMDKLVIMKLFEAIQQDYLTFQ